MPVTFEHTPQAIRLTASGALGRRIAAWQAALDELVFNEQLTTGSFHGRYRVSGPLLNAMQQAKAQGHLMPYYGPGGSRGSCAYRLQRAEAGGYRLTIENSTVHQKADFADDPPEAPPDETAPLYSFVITGQELKNLRGWEHWVEAQAGTPRYAYEFGEVSLGRLGYTIKILDTRTNAKQDITDYSGH